MLILYKQDAIKKVKYLLLCNFIISKQQFLMISFNLKKEMILWIEESS
jgi:hypothetical protein